MATSRWDPFREMQGFRDSMERFFQEGVRRPAGAMFPGMRAGVPINVIEREEAFLVHAMLPGAQPDDVQVTLRGNLLTIQGQYPLEEATPRRPLDPARAPRRPVLPHDLAARGGRRRPRRRAVSPWRSGADAAQSADRARPPYQDSGRECDAERGPDRQWHRRSATADDKRAGQRGTGGACHKFARDGATAVQVKWGPARRTPAERYRQ